MRPRFRLEVERDADELLACLRERLKTTERHVVGAVFRRHVVLSPPSAERHLWSPQLNLSISEEGNSRASIQGRFAPQPNVWTGFMFIYGVLFMGGLGGSMYGLAELSLGRTPWTMLAVPLAIAAFLFIYGAAFIGQGLGSSEMYELRRFLDDCLVPSEPAPREEG